MGELDEKRAYGAQIIDMLKEYGFDNINNQIENTIYLIIHEAFEKGKEFGVREGKNIGINMACKKIEDEIKSMIAGL